jgi:hypothetical protein
MHFLHGLLVWLTAHCWACRVGAAWRYRRNPAVAGVVFISPPFLRFSLTLLLLDMADCIFLIASGQWKSVATVILIAIVGGVMTGLAHGAAEY